MSTARTEQLRLALTTILDAPGFLPPEDIGDRYRVDWKGQRGEREEKMCNVQRATGNRRRAMRFRHASPVPAPAASTRDFL